MKLVVWVLSLNFLHVFTLFVIDIHKNMLISLFPTPFGHFQFLGSAGQNPKLILTLCHMCFRVWSSDIYLYVCKTKWKWMYVWQLCPINVRTHLNHAFPLIPACFLLVYDISTFKTLVLDPTPSTTFLSKAPLSLVFCALFPWCVIVGSGNKTNPLHPILDHKSLS